MFTFLSILFSVSVSFADERQLEPKNFCHSGCSAEQVAIWNAFEGARYAVPAAPSLYSGACYHLSSAYRNTDAHHAVFYLSEVGSSTHASGRFSFYAKRNPYVDFTVENVEKEFPKHLEPKRAVRKLVSSAFLDHSDDETVVRYWFRHSSDGSRLFTVGQWGLWHLIFCELERH